MTDRERESKFQQKEGEQRKAGQETREEMKEEVQEKVQKDLDFLSKKLSNPGFLAKAPEKLVEAEKEKLAKAQEKMDKISQSLAALQ